MVRRSWSASVRIVMSFCGMDAALGDGFSVSGRSARAACGLRGERDRLGALVLRGAPMVCVVQVEVVVHGGLLTMPRGEREREGSEMIEHDQGRS